MRRRDRDRGFSLPEVLIVVVLIGMVAAVLATAITVVLRNTPTTQARAENARTYHGITRHLPRDVASTPLSGFKYYDTSSFVPAVGDVCTGDVSTANLVLLLHWTDPAYPSTFIAEYRVESDRLMRYVCGGSHASTVTRRLTLGLKDMSATATATPDPATAVPTDRIAIELEVKAKGDDDVEVTAVFDAVSRDPEE